MIAHIILSLCFCTKEIFSDGPKGIECIWDLCACSCERQLAFFGFWGLIQALKKCSTFKYREIRSKWCQMECFLVPQRDLGCFCAGAVAPKPALSWWTHPTPLKTEIPTLSTKSQTFYTINFFSDSPGGFGLFLGQCVALCSLAQPCSFNNTFFSLWECPKMRLFS